MSAASFDIAFGKQLLMAISEDELIEMALGVWRRHAHLESPHERMGITLVVACHAAITAALGDAVDNLGTIAMAGEA